VRDGGWPVAWYEEFFTGDWLDIQRARYTDEQSAEIAEGIRALLGLRPSMRVLDVPCGTGAIALALAAGGIAVTGVDLSADLLADARAAAENRGLPLALHQADMRDLPWEAQFDGAVNYWGSFGYFDDGGNEAFCAAVHRALVPAGRFLIEVPTLELFYSHDADRTWSEVAGIRVSQKTNYDFLTGRARVTWTLARDEREVQRVTDIRMYSCPELVTMLRRVGFTAFDTYADLHGAPFGVGERLVLVATR